MSAILSGWPITVPAPASVSFESKTDASTAHTQAREYQLRGYLAQSGWHYKVASLRMGQPGHVDADILNCGNGPRISLKSVVCGCIVT